MNEPILEDAFHNSGKVILIFSVNMSGFFQGYAQMMSSVGWRRDNVWSQGTSRSNPWGRSFKVKWLRLNDLPFQQTLHLKNPLNEYKPVKISRDCQELSPDVGEALCELLDRHDDLNGLNRPCVEPPCSVGEKEYNMPVHLSWSQTPMLYPSMLYQQQPETKRFHLANQKSTDSRPASVLTEDDFLEMSYEEYLEVYGRSRKELYQPGSRSQKSSRSKMQEDDLNSSYGGNLICSRKRAHQSSHKQSQC
ncbi:YTH domain-containing protein 1 [Rosa chinensis]|nr:YTH domain-containing protein 1 [Rosa chinensis]